VSYLCLYCALYHHLALGLSLCESCWPRSSHPLSPNIYSDTSNEHCSSIYGHTSPNTAIAKWTDDLLTTYDFDFSSPSDEDHEEDHDEDHDEDHYAASIVTALTTLSQYLSFNSIDSIWKIIASSAYRNRMIAWALKVVHCEAFVMPVCMPPSYFFHSILRDYCTME
jgi:hypothetical protein